MITSFINLLKENTQQKNAFFILLGSLSIAGFGFIFWTVVARLFPASEVGLATTLISLSTLISLISLAGFDVAFVRFLPRADNKSTYINSGLLIVSIVSIAVSILALIILRITTPALSSILDHAENWVLFCFFTWASAINLLTNAIFLAHRKAAFIFAVNTIFSVIKVVLPILVIGGSAMHIFNIAGIAQVIGAATSLVIIVRALGYRPSPAIDRDLLQTTRKYTSSVYTASLMNLAPPTIIPLMITSVYGSEWSAYYYMAFTIATVLYTIAYASMQSAFAEASHAADALAVVIRKGLKMTTLIMVPAAIVLAIGAPLLLSIFGADYAANATGLLQSFAIGSIFVALYSAFGSVFKVKHLTRQLLVMNGLYLTTILVGSYVFMQWFGLTGIGYAWIAGNLIASAYGYFAYRLSRVDR